MMNMMIHDEYDDQKPLIDIWLSMMMIMSTKAAKTQHKPPGTGDDEEGVLLDCESVSISSSSASTGKRASNAAKLLGR